MCCTVLTLDLTRVESVDNVAGHITDVPCDMISVRSGVDVGGDTQCHRLSLIDRVCGDRASLNIQIVGIDSDAISEHFSVNFVITTHILAIVLMKR